ncbi:MAG TPA: tail fiber domain-containing protein, partial [Longimicrobium sp.]|nr:tail fiber domain-containing protein [Longimicrobium sp.]
MRPITGAAILALLAAALPAPAAAQSDILLRLRSGSPLGDRFSVDSASGLVARGVLGIGIIPFTGAGERLMWHPYKAAFRAGSIGSAGTQWDDPNVGFYTWAGGYNPIALGLSSFAMGYQSTALGSYSNALGYTANADGTGAVAIGYRTTADADYSVAIGQRASTNGHAGAIVLSDGSTTDSTQASANNQFTVRSAGGVRLFTNATMTVGVQVAAGGSSWVVISDRNRKEGFLAVDGEDVLARLRFVPVTTWRYRDEVDRSTLHIGPMAQDWHRAFGFTSDEHTINMSDFDGVNLAAIKALEARTAALQAENAE